MQITLIRHLPTEWNKKTWLQGRRDIEISPLTKDLKNGVDNNLLLLKEMAPFDIVLASTLKRTHETANIYGYQPITEELLDELDFGPFEGLPKENLMKETNNQWVESPRGLVLGESVIELEKRIALFLEKYKRDNNVLVFGHGSWIRAMLSFYQYGHINNMNKLIVENNQCMTLTFNSGRSKGRNGEINVV